MQLTSLQCLWTVFSRALYLDMNTFLLPSVTYAGTNLIHNFTVVPPSVKLAAFHEIYALQWNSRNFFCQFRFIYEDFFNHYQYDSIKMLSFTACHTCHTSINVELVIRKHYFHQPDFIHFAAMALIKWHI